MKSLDYPLNQASNAYTECFKGALTGLSLDQTLGNYADPLASAAGSLAGGKALDVAFDIAPATKALADKIIPARETPNKSWFRWGFEQAINLGTNFIVADAVAKTTDSLTTGRVAGHVTGNIAQNAVSNAIDSNAVTEVNEFCSDYRRGLDTYMGY